MSVLEVEINDHIALVRLNRPDARNALDPEMLLTGKPIDAERALAAAIAANPPLAVRSARKVTRRTNELSEAEAIAMEAEELAFLATTEDAVEGPQAFMEKRAPVVKGR